MAGTASMYGGRLVAARALLERGFALYRPERHGDHAARYGQDPVTTLGFVARVHALLGRPDLARRRGEAAPGRDQRALRATQHPGRAARPPGAAAPRARATLRRRSAHAEAVVAVASGQGAAAVAGPGPDVPRRGAGRGRFGRRDRPRIAEGDRGWPRGPRAYRATGAGLDVPTCLCWLAAGLDPAGRGGCGVAAAGRGAAGGRARSARPTSRPSCTVIGELHAASGRSGDPAPRLRCAPACPSPAASGRISWSSGPGRASPACGAGREGASRFAGCWPRCASRFPVATPAATWPRPEPCSGQGGSGQRGDQPLRGRARPVGPGWARAGSGGGTGRRSEVRAEQGEVGRAEAVGGGLGLVPVGVEQRRRADPVEAGALVGASARSSAAARLAASCSSSAGADHQGADARAAEQPGQRHLRPG